MAAGGASAQQAMWPAWNWPRASGEQHVPEPVPTFPQRWPTRGSAVRGSSRLLIGTARRINSTRQGQPRSWCRSHQAQPQQNHPRCCTACGSSGGRPGCRNSAAMAAGQRQPRGWILHARMLRPAWARTSRRLGPVGGGRLVGAVSVTADGKGTLEGSWVDFRVVQRNQPLPGD